jgi:hypothetical protein
MKAAYRGLAFAVAIGVVLQAAFIAFGTFQITKRIDDHKGFDKDYSNPGLGLHFIFAVVVLLLAIILFAVSFGAHVPEGTKWAGFVLLAVVVQWVLAAISSGVAVVGLLHGANAFVIIALAGITGRRAAEATPARARSTVA